MTDWKEFNLYTLQKAYECLKNPCNSASVDSHAWDKLNLHTQLVWFMALSGEANLGLDGVMFDNSCAIHYPENHDYSKHVYSKLTWLQKEGRRAR